jgi:hypothetical protein
MTLVLHQDRTWLDEHGSDWVGAGLISDEQLESIRHFEHLDEPEIPRRFTIAAEVAAYLGSVLTLMGGALVIGRTWRRIDFAGRLGVAVAIAVVGLAAGLWAYRQGEPGTTRLGSFLTAVGIGGVAFTTGLIADRADPSREEVVPLAIGLAVLAAGLALWRNRMRPLEMLAAAVGFTMAAIAGGSLLDITPWVGGIVFLAVGAMLVVAAHREYLTPDLIAFVIGAAAMFGGGFALSDLNRHLGPAVALLVALGVFAYAVKTDLVPILVLGVGAALIATEALLATTFSGAVSSLVVTLIGLAIVISVLTRTRRAT